MELNYYDNLVEATQDLSRRGYSRQFKYGNDTLISTIDDKEYEADELTIVEYHRFERMTSPAGSSIVFAVEINNEQKGAFIMNYAADADMDIIAFIDKVKIKVSEDAIG